MATRSLPKVQYDGQLLIEDAAAVNLDALGLVQKSEGRLTRRKVYRFLSNSVQTSKTAGILAELVGHPVSRYVIRTREAMAS